MPGKHNAGGCGCCSGCMDCTTLPDTVQVVASAVSGNACCNFPNGTFTVGAASNGTVTSGVSSSRWNVSTHVFYGSFNDPCTWVWAYRRVYTVGCTSINNHPPPQVMDFGATIGQTYIELCETNDELDSSSVVDGQYAVVLKDCNIFIQWLKNPEQITVVIQYHYIIYVCDNNSGANPGAHCDFTINDEYTASSLSCGSLPATINYSGRYVSGSKARPGLSSVSITSDAVTYGYNPASATTYDYYTFNACPALASVALTYA